MLAAFGLTVLFGVTTAQAQSQPGIGPAIDFNGDGLADIADHHLPSGNFWVRLNLGSCTFQAPGPFWASGTTSTPYGTWVYLTGNFNGDAWGDYMDVHPASGQFWYHTGNGAGGFNVSSVMGNGLQTAATSEYFSARAYLTDNYWEFIEHDRASGSLKVWYNFFGTMLNAFGPSSWSSTVGTDWRVLVGDFTGDGLADVADQHIPSGQFWIHRNLGNGNFDATVWAGPIPANPAFTTLVGDYNGDGLADYADLNKATGQFYIHLNLGGGSFNPITCGSGLYTASAGWAVMGTPVLF
jgi:hypothetical protein